jgi:precorrin-4/cobalt-precorrin-4 C11-methyltransferase
LPAEQELDRIARTQATLCLFLSIGKLREVAATLAGHYGADCPAAVVHRASWPDEKVIRGTLADIAEKTEPEKIRATALIIVGRALARDIPASKLYDAAFTHGFRKGKKP